MLSVLDGAVLVVSAVEGVQAQTRVLMRALQRLGVPTLIFVNKLDRRGAARRGRARRPSPRSSRRRSSPWARPAGSGRRGAAFTPYGAGDAAFARRLVDVLADHDEGFLAAYVDDEARSRTRSSATGSPRRRSGRACIPCTSGPRAPAPASDALMAGLTELLPAAAGDAGAPAAGTVFKIERGAAGEKIAYVRMRAGTVRTRDRLRLRGGDEAEGHRDRGVRGRHGDRAAVGRRRADRAALGPGRRPHRRRDRRGGGRGRATTSPRRRSRRSSSRGARRSDGALRVALAQLAEQDPLIDVRQDELRQELSVSLYGEMQKQVIEATLATDFGVDVRFRPTTTICIERPAGSGAAAEIMDEDGEPVPRDRRAARRARAGGRGHHVRAGGRARLDAVRVLHRGRGDGAPDPAAGRSTDGR